MKHLILGFLLLATSAAFAGDVKSTLTTISINEEGQKLLADSRGNTLYVFDVDLNQATSKCNAACAEVWPPYLITAQEVAELKAPLATITRENGKAQLTYNGRPVYTYAFDRGVADDGGNGIGGVWHYIEVDED